MELLTILLGAVVLLFVLFAWHMTKNRGHLETLGIPMDKPMGLLGSGPLDLHNYVMYKEVLSNFKKFGSKTYGRYDGVVPVITTIDPELIKSIMVKNFDSFMDIFTELDDKHTTMDVSGGDKWRVLRKNLSPTFTSGKLKGMLEPMVNVADDTMEHIKGLMTKSKNGEIDVKDVFKELTINMICRCAFSIDANAHKNPDQDLVKYGSSVFQDFRVTNWGMAFFSHLFFYFPYLQDKIGIWPDSFDKVWEITNGLIKQRSQKDIVIDDFVQRLIELKKARDANPDDENLRYLTEDILTAQGVIFFVAGYETTANTLTTMCYNLAKNPQIQDSLLEEIKQVLEDHDGKLSHETISDMPYMDAVINEDLRICPPACMHVRMCTKDVEVMPGFTIKKGMRVDLPIYASHHHEDFFPDPKEFRPERFLKENANDIVPYTYRPFGGGPRLCLGQRFALTEIKLMMAKLLSKYRLVTTENTKLELLKGDQFLFNYPEMKIKLEERS